MILNWTGVSTLEEVGSTAVTGEEVIYWTPPSKTYKCFFSFLSSGVATKIVSDPFSSSWMLKVYALSASSAS